MIRLSDKAILEDFMKMLSGLYEKNIGTPFAGTRDVMTLYMCRLNITELMKWNSKHARAYTHARLSELIRDG